MIPENAITEWRKTVPWHTSEQVEQDLIICKALSEIYKSEFLATHLAFRGGTALHKLYLNPQPRYSEDIDLVQINQGPIKPIIDHIREVLSFLGEPIVKQKKYNNTLIFRFESEIPPIMPLRLKVEINCMEHFNVLGSTKIDFDINNQWYKAKATITTYKLEELLGTKLRALYQRRKGRDLFDLYKGLLKTELNTKEVISCYHEYMKFSVEKPPTQKEYLLNTDKKNQDSEFIGDIDLLLRPEEVYNPDEAYQLVRMKLLEKI